MTAGSDRFARRTARLRWNDFDVLGHLNQAVYHELLEDGRFAVMSGAGADHAEFVLARVELDYRREIPISQPEVTVESGVERIGRSSIRLVQRIIRADGELAAEGITVVVGFDPQTRRSRPLRDDERAALQRWSVAAETA